MTLDPSDTAPVFSLPDAAGNLVSLADFRLERAKSHAKFAAKYQLPFPRLCDSKAEVAQQLRLLRTQKVYGQGIYGHYSIDRERSTLMVRWKRFTACVKPKSHAAEILADLSPE